MPQLGSMITCLPERRGLDLTAFRAVDLFRNVAPSSLSWLCCPLPSLPLPSTETDLGSVHPWGFQSLFTDLASEVSS